jgi:hypothetical protein
MTNIIFYPLGNADCCFMKTGGGYTFVFDYADMHQPEDSEDKRMPLLANFRQDLGWPKCKEIDVLAITHGDNDHIKGIPEAFWLNHDRKYQGEDRIKIRDLWVPAAMLFDGDAEGDCKILKTEIQHRFLKKEGIRVFARPEHLSDWLNSRGRRLDDFRDIITDAGQLVPGWAKEHQGIEFFVHSPFAERTDDGLLDRNENCLVMQATIRESNVDTRYLITADSVSWVWQKMVQITRKHKNDERLAWDLFSVPHHGSYLSMAEEKGEEITEPTEEFKWLLEQGTTRSVMVCSSREVLIEEDPDDVLPPHLQTYRRYKQTADELDGEIVVTMENPSIDEPRRTVVKVDQFGVTLKKESPLAAAVLTSTVAPKAG